MKFWHSNRLDQEAEYDPVDVARQFIAAVRDGYDLSASRPSIDFAFRWWLTDPKAFNATWEQQDYDELWDALVAAMSVEDEKFIWDKLMPSGTASRLTEQHHAREARAAE